MTDINIDAVASEFGVSLPKSYLRFLRDFPTVLSQPCIQGRPDLGAPCDEWALRDPAAIQELNREFWDFWPEMEFNEKERPFPRHRFLIGSIDGDLLAISTRSLTLVRVLIYKHEHGWWLPFAVNMWQFTRRIAARME